MRAQLGVQMRTAVAVGMEKDLQGNFWSGVLGVLSLRNKLHMVGHV